MKPEPLFLTETEIAARIGLSKADWQIAVITLERGGLVRPDPLFANKRYWPAVRAFLDRRYNLGSGAGLSVAPGLDGGENWSKPQR